MEKVTKLTFGFCRQLCNYRCLRQKLTCSWQPSVHGKSYTSYLNGFSICGSLMTKHLHTTQGLYATRANKSKKKIRKPVKLKQQNRKASWDVVDIWKDMTVLHLAKSLGKDLDHIFEALIYVPGTDSFDKPDSVIHDFNVIKEVVDKCGFRWKLVSGRKQVEKENKDVTRRPPPDPSVLVKRPPVVTIMGHVDHGKTTLLDSLRKTNVVASEFGGITQHIGAFSINLPTGENLTFLDTPGHAAFSAMRARGANVTDIVVLVVAADDGVMEQTVESIKFARDANVPVIVAINKIDRFEADVERTKQLLLQHGLQLEEDGGDVQAVPISALKGTNLDELLESILTLADVLDLQADPEGMVEGVVIESRTDTGRGKLCTALMQRGTLTKGSHVVAGGAWARVRSMFDENGHPVVKALPGMPVEIVGWKELPSAGDEIIQVESEKRAKEVMMWRHSQQMEQKALEDHEVIKVKQAEHNEIYHRERQAKLDRGIRFSSIFRRRPVEVSVESTDPELAIIVKGDVHGSMEAILDSIATYKSPQCKLHVVNYDVGDICEEDIEMATPFNGVVYAFNVKCSDKVRQLAYDNKVDIVHSNVIYMLVDDLRGRLSHQLPHIEVEETVGEAHVLQTFMIDEGKKKVAVAGCRCTKGVLKKKNMFKLVRDEEVILTGPLSSLKHFKQEMESIPMNSECGLSFENKTIVPHHGDIILCYEMKKQPQELDWDLMY